MSDLQSVKSRLIEEARQLTLKIDKLYLFINSDKFNDLSIDMQLLNKAQLGIMQAYHATLLNKINGL